MLNTCLLMVLECCFAFNYTPLCYAYLLEFPCFLILFIFFLSWVPDTNYTFFLSLTKNCDFPISGCFLCAWNKGHISIRSLVQIAGLFSGFCETSPCCMCTTKVKPFRSEQTNRLKRSREYGQKNAMCRNQNPSFLYFY